MEDERRNGLHGFHIHTIYAQRVWLHKFIIHLNLTSTVIQGCMCIILCAVYGPQLYGPHLSGFSVIYSIRVVTVLLGWLNKTEKIFVPIYTHFQRYGLLRLMDYPWLQGVFCHLSALLYCLYQCCEQSALAQYLNVKILLPI